MDCLHCGDCCLRMSPIGSPCPKLLRVGSFYFCGDYDNRPEQCKNHEFEWARFCPIGIDKLQISDPQDAYNRINEGYEIIKRGFREIPRLLTARKGDGVGDRVAMDCR